MQFMPAETTAGGPVPEPVVPRKATGKTAAETKYDVATWLGHSFIVFNAPPEALNAALRHADAKLNQEYSRKEIQDMIDDFMKAPTPNEEGQ
jgi:hypothetical protein